MPDKHTEHIEPQAVPTRPEAIPSLSLSAAAIEGVSGDSRRQLAAVAQMGSSPTASELSPEQTEIMGVLRARYERNDHRIACHDEVAWSKVEAKLSANPGKLDSLKRMEDTGGEPDVTGVEGDDFLFDETARELPAARRHQLNYLKAVERAEAMGGGAKLMHPERFTKLVNEMKIFMDQFYPVWLDTSDRPDLLNQKEHFEAGLAQTGALHKGEAFVGQINAGLQNTYGFRCSLRV